MGEKEAIEILKGQGMTQAEAEDFVEGVKRGIKARREGDRIPWSQVKKELGIDQQDSGAPTVYCPKDGERVPIWYCLGSLTQGREACPYLVKATVHGVESAEVECKWRPDKASV